MIEETLYNIEIPGYSFYVIANDFGEAEKIAKEVIENDNTLNGAHIYHIHKNGYVYHRKTKTITIEV